MKAIVNVIINIRVSPLYINTIGFVSGETRLIREYFYHVTKNMLKYSDKINHLSSLLWILL